MRRSFVLAAALLFGAPARALLTQPDGTVIPVREANDNLWDLFSGLGEPISPPADAADVPETYSPACHLQFTLLSRGTAGFHNAFGWYNVVDGGPPAQSDLHVLLDCTTQPPASVPLDIARSGQFTGGQIGFFLITPQGKSSMCASLSNVGEVYYSQKEYNPDHGLQNGQSYIHLITYDSKLTRNRYYFCWEDLFNGGDNEFKDLVAQVDGITCTGGGGPCSTGKQGICALGIEQCVDGKLTCVQQFQPQKEQCNGLDNDCDGVIGNGATCPGGQVCVEGRCRPPCNAGEFSAPCPAGQQCAGGLCLDPACQGVACPAGETCTAGTCSDPCAGVVCPRGQQCGQGRCFDPCTAVTCGEGEVCQDGACETICQCAGCPAGKVCQADGTCIDAACEAASCDAGTYCSGGACVDDCASAVCPTGQNCDAGVCVPAPPKEDAGAAESPDAGATRDAGMTRDAGRTVEPDAGRAAIGPSSPDAGPQTDGGGGSGCGCGSAPGETAVLALAILAMLRRRPR